MVYKVEAKQFTYKAKTPQNQAILNRTVKALVKYNNLNNQRDLADNDGDEKLFNKLDKQCEVAFDNYLELADELPKYERVKLENSDVYLHYAKGGVIEHGLRKGDTIIDDMFWANEAVVKDAKGVKHKVDLDKGKRYAKGGNIKSGDLVRVKKYGWIMEFKGMDGEMLMLSNSPKSMNYQRQNGLTQLSGNNGTYLFSDVETIKKMAKGGKMEMGGSMSEWCYSIGGL